jgi:hypothetical protein
LPVIREWQGSLPTSRLPGTDRPLPVWITLGIADDIGAITWRLEEALIPGISE